jgi:hypothetical protein
MAKRLRTVWLKSFKNMPKNLDLTAGSVGAYDAKTNTIYLVKGVSPESTGFHEKYHSVKRHPNKPRNPSAYALQEIEANLYAYKQCGQPKQILMRLKGIHNDLMADYGLTRRQVMAIIRKALLSQKDIPSRWMKDFEELKKQSKASV